MPWKTDENGAIVADNGNPIWIYESGPEKDKEAPVDFAKTLASIQTTNRESIARKEKINELKAITDKIEQAGIENLDEYLAEANKAMETVSNLSDKEILDAGEVDKIKKSITDGFTRQIEAMKTASETEKSEWQGKLDGKDKSIRNLIIKGAFDASEFLRDKTNLLPDVAFAYFGDRFDVEDKDGKLTGFARDVNGDKIISLKNPGGYADPAEAIEILVNEHPQKDRMLKMEASGSGMKGASGGGSSVGLAAQYKEAKSKGDVAAMISLKGQMVAEGIAVPL